jgi:membrane protein implicated in regulation of membrane protease activity
MSDFAWWSVIALVLLGLELASGAFYLLALAVAAGAAALAALIGAGQTSQLLVAAVTGLISLPLAHRFRSRHRSASGVQDNPDVLADIGRLIAVDTWTDDARGFTQFRGARWEVSLENGQDLTRARQAQSFRIVRIDGIRLVVVAV